MLTGAASPSSFAGGAASGASLGAGTGGGCDRCRRLGGGRGHRLRRLWALGRWPPRTRRGAWRKRATFPTTPERATTRPTQNTGRAKTAPPLPRLVTLFDCACSSNQFWLPGSSDGRCDGPRLPGNRCSKGSGPSVGGDDAAACSAAMPSGSSAVAGASGDSCAASSVVASPRRRGPRETAPASGSRKAG